MYDQGIHISLDEYTVFREAAQQAAKKKQSLLILPCHKSHIVRSFFFQSGVALTSISQDYLTVSWIFYRLGLSLPHIVAGDNLNMPVLGAWLQKCGAFFIRRYGLPSETNSSADAYPFRRSFGDDALYPVVVKGKHRFAHYRRRI